MLFPASGNPSDRVSAFAKECLRLLRGRIAFYGVVGAFGLQVCLTLKLEFSEHHSDDRVLSASILMAAYVATVTLGNLVRAGRAFDMARTHLRRLIARESVEIVFQPIWNSQSGKLMGYEALSRPAAGSGFKSADALFGVAETAGLADELDAVCHGKILTAARSLDSGLPLFVNFSLQSLRRGRPFVEKFTNAVKAKGFKPEWVVVELTERSELTAETLRKSVGELRAKGFRIALDDTGAGNSGLAVLSYLPIDYVKIDRALIVRAITEPNARGVLAGILAIARETESLTIAEGIDDLKLLELATLFRGGASGLQGYLLAVPRSTQLDHGEVALVESKISALRACLSSAADGSNAILKSRNESEILQAVARAS
jgi:EAL domain-containing protein (putative c-di-GMP-specific phosphodiesterase class I)